MARSPAPPASPAFPAAAGNERRSRSLVANLLLSLRPSQWTKNLIVFAGLIFGERLFDAGSVTRAVLAFAVFCLLSGVVYLVNDVRDREADRLHPTKSRRPIASGALPAGVAASAAVLFAAAALAVAFGINTSFGLVAFAYVGLLVLYSASLKHMVILDVLTIAVGFVLRAVGGAVAIDVPFSHWLLLLTLLLALFLALSKRRAEIVALADVATHHRRILAEYSPYLLDQMIGVVTASTLLAYAFYTISPDTVARFNTDRLLITVPFPLYGIFRYLYLVHQRQGGGNPSEALLTDKPLLACVALWAGTVIFVLYGPWR
jgi:4-hydroxybenzoate polyprenyltransferase